MSTLQANYMQGEEVLKFKLALYCDKLEFLDIISIHYNTNIYKIYNLIIHNWEE